MSTVSARELRNHTAVLLREVAAGGSVTITSHGTPVAELYPVSPGRRSWFGRAEMARILGVTAADLGLRADLEELAGDTTDDLGSIE